MGEADPKNSLMRGFHHNATHATNLRNWRIFEITHATQWRHYWIGRICDRPSRQRLRRMPLHGLARWQSLQVVADTHEIKII